MSGMAGTEKNLDKPILDSQTSIPNESSNSFSFGLDTSIYDLTTIYKTCYIFTNRCYLYLARGVGNTLVVRMKPKEAGQQDLAILQGEFCNELINQRMRHIVNQETGKIRELLVAQAFAEGNLLDFPSPNAGIDENDYLNDPLHVAPPDTRTP